MLTNEHPTEKQIKHKLTGNNYIWQMVSSSLNPKANITLIFGPEGIGKTFWYKKMQQELPNVETIQCSSKSSIKNVIKQMACIYKVKIPLGPHSVQEYAIEFAKSINIDEESYLLIDDAQNLDCESIEFLLILNDNINQHNMNIIFFAQNTFINKINQVKNHRYIHEIALRPMNIEDIEKFVKCTYHTLHAIDEDMLRRLHQASGGIPKKTMTIIKDLWDDLFVHTQKIDPPSSFIENKIKEYIPETQTKTKIKIKWKKILITFFALVLLVYLLILRFNTVNTTTNPEKEIETSINVETITHEEKEKNNIDFTNLYTIEEKAPQQENINNTEASSDISTTDNNTTDNSTTDDSTTDTENIKHAYFIQLAYSDNKNSSLFKNISADISDPDLKIIQNLKDDSTYILVIGPYESYKQTKQKMNELPEEIIKNRQPWIREILESKNVD